MTLEPCAHEGRQPPCTEAILEAGISRVVYASEDPTDKASGRGPGMLRDGGVEVELAGGPEASAARLLNQPFRKRARTGRPLVTYKAAMSLDGRVASPTGDSRWISSVESRELVHRWRAECDAVAIGIGTALADDPLLTARIEGAASQPARVVFDSGARLPIDSALVGSIDEAPLIVICAPEAPSAKRDALEGAGAEVIAAPGRTDRDRLEAGLTELGRRDIQDLLVEGGPTFAGALFDAGEVDELRLFIAPVLVGAAQARAVLEGEGAVAHRRRRPPAGDELRAGGRGHACPREASGMVRSADVHRNRQGAGASRVVDASDDGARLRIGAQLASELSEGDSVAVNGACLTATLGRRRRVRGGRHAPDPLPDHARRAGALLAGQPRASPARRRPAGRPRRPGPRRWDRHGHGRRRPTDSPSDVRIELPDELLPYVVERGSIAIEGVSLTIATSPARCLEVSLIPETLERTTLGTAEPGDHLNVECDVLARYVQRQLSSSEGAA